ncbi:proteasome component [Schizosaccharomyces cryophilus OY26]|uniref:Proteasome component n=1 Tax=Schizosaccharomyces cryophilus (strain OY26 / ATCC MYA-4695 / CBS 11777 / NBRC 106824 / NRRL Y48691) TaxID=653667 RepID=S9X075_SCHCR|nr:proteasome component [Schizosaccharomyces cryophilus OY26]EPY50332.1 proteasome component [Schizosaccharomyces cryophilus OY26]
MADAELRLLNGVEFKFALAKNSESFQSLISVYLAPILLKLDSPHEPVRNKTITIANHVMTRVTSETNLQLPMLALVKQYIHADQPLRKRFLLAFITIGKTRLPSSPPPDTQLLQICLSHVNKHPIVLMSLTIRLLQMIHPTPSISCPEEVCFILSSFFLIQSSQTVFTELQHNQKTVQYRRGVLNWFEKSEWPKTWNWLAYFFASSDTHKEVAQLADDLVRNADGAPDVENRNHVKALLDIVLDDFYVDPLRLKLSVPISLRNKALQYLLHSNTVCTDPNSLNCIKLILKAPPTLQSRLIQFTRWISANADPDFLKPRAAGILEDIFKILSNSAIQNELLRGFLYTSVGLLAKSNSELISTSLLSTLLSALQVESPDVRVAIDESLSIILPFFNNYHSPYELLPIIEKFIISTPNSPAASSSLRYLLVAFPFQFLPSRFLCLKTQDSNIFPSLLSEEAKKGLFLSRWLLHNNVYLDFAKNKDSPTSFAFYPDPDDAILHLVAEYNPEALWKTFSVEVCSSILSFIKRCMSYQVTKDSAVYDDNDVFNSLLRSDLPLRTKFSKLISSLKYLQPYFRFLFEGVLLHSKEAAFTFDQFSSLASPDILAEFSEEDLMKQTLVAPSNLRDTMSRSLGLLLSTKDYKVIFHYLETLLRIIKTSNSRNDSLSKNITALFIIGYTVSFSVYRNGSEILSSANGSILEEFFSILYEYLQSGVSTDKRSALSVYQGIFLNISMEDLARQNVQLNSVIETIVAIAKLEKDTSLRILAMTTLSHIPLSLHEPFDPDLIDTIINTVYLSYHDDSPDILFASAESMTNIAGGLCCTFTKTKLPFRDFENENTFSPLYTKVLSKILDEWSKSSRPLLRKASSLWLYYMLQFCTCQAYTHERFNDIYHTFLTFLVDQDDFIQDTASKGLKAVYDLLDGEKKKGFTTNLISTITADRVDPNTKAPLDADTALFTTNQGSVTTYKDICSLASESGNPDLVYSFLSIANTNSVWQARKGLATGLGYMNISDDEKQKLFTFNSCTGSQLLTRLYLYRHDPNISVAKTMTEIWNSLVPSNLDLRAQRQHLVSSCLDCMGDYSWRVRESGVNSLVDLLSNVPVLEYLDQLEGIWRMAYRTLDDIKESVRISSFPLCKLLARAVIQTVENTSVNTTDTGLSRCRTIMSIAVPFLLKCCHEKAKEIQSFSYSTITALVKFTNPALSPFVPSIIEIMLEYLTKYESNAASFMEFHSSTYNVNAEDLDSARVSAVQGSSMMSNIEKCISILNEESMKDLAPVLLRMITRTTGVPTKVGSAQICMLLVIRRQDLIIPYAPKFNQALKASIFNKNGAVNSSSISALGYLLRVTPLNNADEVCRDILSQFYEGDEFTQTVCANFVRAAARFAPDLMQNLGSTLFPFIFFGKHSSFNKVSSVLRKLWDDTSSGGSSINLYKDEILKIIRANLEATQWDLRRPSAEALLSFVQSSRLNNSEEVYALLVAKMKERSWPGKEYLLESYVQFAIKCPEFIRTSKLDEVLNILKREVLRRNISYKMQGIRILGDFLSDSSYQNVQFYDFCMDECEFFLEDAWFHEEDSELSMDDKVQLQMNVVYLMASSCREGDDNRLIQSLIKTLDQNYLHWKVKLEVLRQAHKIRCLLKDPMDSKFLYVLARCFEGNPSPRAKDYAENILGNDYLKFLRN